MKTIKVLALMAIALPMAFVSCSDDDDDDALSAPPSDALSSPSEDVSIITTEDGDRLLVKSISSPWHYDVVSFTYDSQGRCTSANCWDEWTLLFSYAPYKVAYDDTYAEDETYSFDFSFNGSGYIYWANIKYSEEDEEYDESYSVSESYSYSYDSDGHLTKVSASYSESGIEDGYKYSGSGNADMTVTWESGDITQVVLSVKEKEGGYTYESKDTYKYEYGSTQNEYKQYVLAIVEEPYDWMTEWVDLAFIGYFGKGTAHLPTSYKYEYEENDDGYTDNGTGSQTFSYEKNSDGTIKTETWEGQTYNYTYTSLDSDDYDTRSAVPTFEDAFSTPWNTNKAEHKHTFGHYSKRHSKHRTAE